MVATKVATLNLRIDPALKEALRIAALRDHRSIANLSGVNYPGQKRQLSWPV